MCPLGKSSWHLTEQVFQGEKQEVNNVTAQNHAKLMHLQHGSADGRVEDCTSDSVAIIYYRVDKCKVGQVVNILAMKSYNKNPCIVSSSRHTETCIDPASWNKDTRQLKIRTSQMYIIRNNIRGKF